MTRGISADLLEQRRLMKDRVLLKKLQKRRLRTIPDVIGLMLEIQKLLGKNDGVWWFNSLYLRVTKAILRDWEKGKWADQKWLVHLDVEFAQLYFQALESWLSGSEETPLAWRPLFSCRYRSDIAPVQFALAGVNAHINRDLALAVVAACRRTKSIPARGTNEEADYIRVNEILEAVEVKAMQQMARGMLKFVSEKVNPLDRKLAMTFIGWARDVAWDNAERYWHWTEIAPNQTQAAKVVKNMDRVAERMGKGLLLPSTVAGRALL